MDLSILDRMIIIKSILPESGTIDEIKLIISIKNKIKLTEEEWDSIKISKTYGNIVEISNITDDLIKRDSYYNLIEEEIIFLKKLTSNYNANGWVTETSLSTVEYILNYSTND